MRLSTLKSIPGESHFDHHLIDIFASLQYLIEKNSLSKYRISTYGPGYQTVDYLHFHLRADLSE